MKSKLSKSENNFLPISGNIESAKKVDHNLEILGHRFFSVIFCTRSVILKLDSGINAVNFV